MAKQCTIKWLGIEQYWIWIVINHVAYTAEHHVQISSSPTATLCIILMTQYTPYHLISSDEKKSKWTFFTFWQFVFARWSSLQACWAFRINLRILHIYFPNRIHNSKVSFNFSRQADFSFVVFPLQDIHIRKIIWLVKRSVTSHGNSPKWNPACPSTSWFYPPMKFLLLSKVCARIYILHIMIFFEFWPVFCFCFVFIYEYMHIFLVAVELWDKNV